MKNSDDLEFFDRRREQEIAASDAATDPVIKRLHWEMAQRYEWLARKEEAGNSANTVPDQQPTIHQQR